MKKVIYIFTIALVGLYLIYGLTGILSNIKTGSLTDSIIGIALFLLITWFEVYLIKRYRRNFSQEAVDARAREKFDRESQIPGSKARQQLLGADLCIKVKHMAGLPLAEGAEVFLYRCQDKIVFERNQDTINLTIEKIQDILIKTDVEIQKSYSSSIGGAVGGYVLFGPLGAMIGGRSKEKKSTVTEEFLIFAYINKDNEQDYISFEVTNEPRSISFTNYYNLTKTERTTVEL